MKHNTPRIDWTATSGKLPQRIKARIKREQRLTQEGTYKPRKGDNRNDREQRS